MNFCDACGLPGAYISIGNAMLCRTCDPDIMAEIDKLHAQGKPVNALAIARQYFREHHSAADYTLRDIPRDLKLAIQHRALDEGLTLREITFKAWTEYLKQTKG